MKEVIRAKNLTLGYNKDESIIKDTSFLINSGDFIFITGKSGSGKSTIIKSLYGELALRSGTLEVCGINMNNISDSNLNTLRRYIGIIFQDYRLISEWSIEKNIMLPLMIGGYSKSVCKNQAEKLLNHVKLTHMAHKKPLELSGGEQQRVAVARALAHNPILLLADEPTGNLDEYSSDVIWRLLKSARDHLDTTVVVVTHKIPSSIGLNYKDFFLERGVLHEVS